ncbi:hypothetical protein PR002_g31054 [Phytophthora rubi]|uniref:Uncharacterized protein n=1 Tax=Phytophthora rubi TaxID=129364 RepID=A0A6A3GKA1_9STRA|nr:hypothetical protein PR002_g31054 [Phytophthora rubi]
MGDALAISSGWTTLPAAEEPTQPSPWTTAGTEQEEQVQFVEELVEKTPVVVEEVEHEAPSRSWPSKLSAFPRSVSSTSNVSAPRDVAGMTRNDKA